MPLPIPGIRTLLALAALALGLFELTAGRSVGALFLLAAALLWWLDRREAPVIGAFRALSRGDVKRARILNARMKDPSRLGERMRAYHEWVEAGISEADGDLTAARAHLARALELPLRRGRHRVIALCSLASICGRLGDRAEAQSRLTEAEALEPPPDLKPLVARVRQEVRSYGAKR